MSQQPYHEQISQSLSLFSEVVGPDLEGRLRTIYGSDWRVRLQSGFRDHRRMEKTDGTIDWDAQLILTTVWDHWNALFRNSLGHLERSLVSELREFRNQWAHQKSLSFDDAFRVMDSIERLLKALHHHEPADAISQMKKDMLAASLPTPFPAANTLPVTTTPVVISSQPERYSPLQTILISIICCLFILGQIYVSWNNRGWLMMVVTVFVFSLLVYNRIKLLIRKPAH